MRLQFDAGAVGDSGAVANRQSQLEVGRILVVGGNELPARDAIELLNRVRVAVGRAVLHDERPRQRRARQRAILGVAARAVGLLLLTLIVTVAVSVTPFVSVTRRRAVTVPAAT